ncbi:uncharacterized protein B0T23DRAFT_96936 [Neurospora hispaniola]|uniref:Uncharacterized protein n=1 Tax=Neurospora hispaniola TaxID=588809 RepID=A0AAJ0IEV2_9PEZI|nr:hypothetical protein B0T23DRAFT_96936 [Neurospora hispaniola]
MYLLRRHMTTLTTPHCPLSHPIPRSIPQSAISSVVPNNCKSSSNPCLTSRRYYTCSLCRPQLMAASGLMVLALCSIVSFQSTFPRAPSVTPSGLSLSYDIPPMVFGRPPGPEFSWARGTIGHGTYGLESKVLGLNMCWPFMAKEANKQPRLSKLV